MPPFAPTPLPTIIATGVASPRAQGQLITRTEIPLAIAKPKSAPLKIHIANVTAATPKTTGTKTPETLSAAFETGAFIEVASLTILIICERVVSSATRNALHFKKPRLFIVAPVTLSPTNLSTGMLSPVILDSSTEASPSTTIPSAGMLSPAFTIKTSPTTNSSAGIKISLPSRKTVALLGARSISPRRASAVFPFERASRSFPTVISVSIIAADSK